LFTSFFSLFPAGGKEPQKAKNKGGLIAGIVITLFVIFAVVLVAAMYYRWRRGPKQFAAQRFENVEHDQGDVKL